MAEAAFLATLCEAFPATSPTLVAAALRKALGNVDLAAAELMALQQHSSPRRSPSSKQGLGPQRRNASWGTLADATGQHTGHNLPVAPKFKPAARASRDDRDAALLNAADFPAGPQPAGRAGGAAAEAPASTGLAARPQWAAPKLPAGPSRRQVQQQEHRQPQKHQHQRQQRQQQWGQQQQRQQQQGRQQQQKGQPQRMPPRQGGANVQQAQHQLATQRAEQHLAEVFSWAGRELVAAVLAALGGDPAAAAAALADMVASEDCWEDGGSLPAEQQAQQQAQQVQQAQRAQQQPPPVHEARSRQGAAELAASGAVGGTCDAAAAAAASGTAAEEESEEDGSQDERADPYYRHRRQALRLTRQWQRAGRGAAAAFAAGQHGAARQLAAQAQWLRRDALVAHAEAAERIEVENNRHSSPFELDLHGLHAQEATAALQRRLDLLHTVLLADPASSAASGAAGRQLRVVVGRGAHSSDGEASIPRVVESHLQAAGLRFWPRLGAVDVQLRGAAGLSASRAAAAASVPGPPDWDGIM